MTDQSNEIFKAYSILGLPINASQTNIKEKFKELALQVSLPTLHFLVRIVLIFSSTFVLKNHVFP